MSNWLLMHNIIRDKDFIFWQVAFPIIMVTMFTIAFSGLIYPDSFELNIAVNADNPHLPIYQMIPILNIEKLEQSTAETKLKEQQIVAYIRSDNSILVEQNGMSATIIASIVDQIEQVKSLGYDYRQLNFMRNFLSNNKQSNHYDAYYTPFYAIIAMNAMYAAFTILEVGISYTANLSAIGHRVEMAPQQRWRLFGSALLMSIAINFTTNLLCIGYVKLVLRLPIFDQLGLSMLIILAVNLFGAALGLVINTLRFDYKIKSAIIVASSLALSFLSGMMIITLRAFILKNIPILAMINPVSLATTTLFRLNMLGDSSSYYQSIVIILAIAALLFGLAIIMLRRRRYDSI